MRKLHDEDYDGLEKCFVDIFSDVALFQLLSDGLLRNDVDPRLGCLLAELNTRFDRHVTSLSGILERIDHETAPTGKEEPVTA